jgi:23S rRNA pseudouridine1911/1915/1917 synthase
MSAPFAAQTFTFTANEDNRLDKFLVTCLPDLTRSRIQGLIKDGQVWVNERPATKAGQPLEAGNQVRVEIPAPQPSGLVAEDIPLDILFENEDVLVINKPAGIVVHPALGHTSGTVVNAALAHAPEMEGINGEQRPGVVHRLDKDTSGVLVLAKNDRAHNWLVNQFRNRDVEKIYLALVDGHPATPKGRIEAPIGRDPSNRQRMAVVSAEKGREAVSEFYTRESFAHYTLLEVHLLTGRTHQIRVHMAFLGCPVVADSLYGRRKASLDLGRHFLHAQRLTITLPGEKQPRTFEAPLPPELESALSQLRGSLI